VSVNGIAKRISNIAARNAQANELRAAPAVRRKTSSSKPAGGSARSVEPPTKPSRSRCIIAPKTGGGIWKSWARSATSSTAELPCHSSVVEKVAISSAMPIAAPSWREVLRMPEARPSSWPWTAPIAPTLIVGNPVPRPIPIRTRPGKTIR
jgi:hypothetical protein